MRRLAVVLACAASLLAIAPVDAQAARTSAIVDVRREVSGPLRVVSVPGDAALRVVADSVLAAELGGGMEIHRLDADVRELSRYVGIGFAAGTVAGLLVGAVVEDENGLYAAPLLILYTAGGATAGMVAGAIVYFARGGRT